MLKIVQQKLRKRKMLVLYFLGISAFVALAECKTSFIKDLKTDVPFPPNNIQTVAGIPEGHLRPLGWQKKPDGRVREEKDSVSAPTFYLRYVKQSRPVVLRGAIKNDAVLEQWEQDNYLKKTYGELNMTITVKKEVMNRGPERTRRRMLLRKFLLDYMYENWYLASTVHDVMRDELLLPEVLSCGTFKDRLTEAELWMSSGGASSLLHSHGDHNIHCVMDGRKDFILIEQKHKSVFNFAETYVNSGSGQSPMDMDMINVYKHPKIARTPWDWSTLWQGDCIYVPAGYLHQVRSYGRGISYTVQFSPSSTFESEDCGEETTPGKRKKRDKRGSRGSDKEATGVSEEGGASEGEKKLTLADVEFVWTYSDGQRHLSDRKFVPSTLRRLLLILIRDGDQLHKTQFEHFFEDAVGPPSEQTPKAAEVFHLMTPNDNREYVSRDEISALADSRLKAVCDVINKVRPRVRDEL